YSYDAIGNLVFVNQGGQTRTFEYDSLRRLVAVQQPESGTSSFTYDKNGNLLTSTDARGFGTFFSYDDLNRPTTRRYSSDPATPTVKFFYDGQSLPPGAPNFSRGASIGRLVAVTNEEGSSGDYYGYDALGRNTSKVQQTDGINFPMAATYNIEGALVAE